MNNPHDVLREAIARPEECVELTLGRGRTGYLRWDAEKETFEAVVKEPGYVSEQFVLPPHYAASFVALGPVSEWRPVEYFVATCNPGDRPVVA